MLKMELVKASSSYLVRSLMLRWKSLEGGGGLSRCLTDEMQRLSEEAFCASSRFGMSFLHASSFPASSSFFVIDTRCKLSDGELSST